MLSTQGTRVRASLILVLPLDCLELKAMKEPTPFGLEERGSPMISLNPK